MKVAKWGNSLAVRLPRALVEELSLQEGDEVSLVVTGNRSLDVVPERRKEELIRRMRELSTPLPPGYKFDRDEANER